MRPVSRGPEPAESHTWTHWRDASALLSQRIGWYCAYCEIPVKIAIPVEHKLPKSSFPQLQLEWTNLLPACAVCNSIKGDVVYPLDSCVWPDRDNTARAFSYPDNGLVEVSDALPPGADILAESTNQMVGLDRVPETDEPDADLRWAHRMTAWDVAKRQRDRLRASDTEALRNCISELASATGFWSVWMTAFHDDVDMRQRFIAAFRGTSADCFQGDVVVQRPGGAI